MSAGWHTIESDAGVFTYLMENLGVKDVQFEELLALEPDDLRQISPLYGVIFLFKYPTDEKPRADQPIDGTFDYEAANKIFFANQTIQNACGTQALLSVLLNKEGEMDIGPTLKDFKSFTLDFPPEYRGDALSNSEIIRDVHNSFARASPFADETTHDGTEPEDVYHFIAYTAINDTLYELDGLQPAPISHGPCPPGSFPDRVIPVLQKRIERYPAHEIRFNLLAMVRDLRIRAREFGDKDAEAREARKREEWRLENALRKHNFVGFVGEILKGVVRSKLQEGGSQYDDWIKEAVEKTKKTTEERRRRKVAAK